MPTKSEYDRRKSLGLCVECGAKPSEEGRVRCEQCLSIHRRRDNKLNTKKHNKRKKKKHQDPEMYSWRKEHGLCVRCGTETPVEGKLFCWRCLMAKRDDRATQYVRRVDNGLCASCGKPLDREGVICETCRLKRKQANAERTARLVAAGLCPVCGKRPVYDGRLCAICRAKKQQQDNARYKRRAA